MKSSVYPKLLTLLIACLFIVVVALLLRFFSDPSSSSNSRLNSPPREVTSVKKNVPAEGMKPEPIQLLAICSGPTASVEVEACRRSFIEAGETLSLGERLLYNPSASVSAAELEFSLNNSSNPITFFDIDVAISDLETSTIHSIRIRRVGEDWSNEIKFQVSLQELGQAIVEGVCADLICAPGNSLVAPINPGIDSLYPLVENVFGLTDPPTKHIWIELMLDSDDSFLGCINCQAAETAQFTYPDRIPFGATGIFYNWDVKKLDAGSHSLQARLRNKLYVGPWSSEFIFEVQRP